MKRKKTDFLKTVFKPLLITGCILLGIFLAILIQSINMQRQHMLAEAKNAELALRLIGIECYGQNKQIYDALSPNGMNQGIEEQIQRVSQIEGSLYLTSWNARRCAPERFEYTKGNWTVIYHYNQELQQEEWKISFLTWQL